MLETVTVKEAIKRGRNEIVLPMILIFCVFFSISFCFAFMSEAVSLFPIGIFLSLIGPFIYRGFVIAKWKNWAFERVKNVHELLREAKRARLIFPENSIFEKMERSSADEKVKWYLLQKRFNEPDKFEDDPTIPLKTIIHYSKVKKILWVMVFSISLLAGLGLLYFDLAESYIFGSLLTLFGGTFIFIQLRQAFNRTPQIVMDDEGLSTAKTQFYKWQDISDEKIVVRGSGKVQAVYLTYECPDGSVAFQLDDVEWSGKLERLMRIYRGRSAAGLH